MSKAFTGHYCYFYYRLFVFVYIVRKLALETVAWSLNDLVPALTPKWESFNYVAVLMLIYCGEESSSSCCCIALFWKYSTARSPLRGLTERNWLVFMACDAEDYYWAVFCYAMCLTEMIDSGLEVFGARPPLRLTFLRMQVAGLWMKLFARGATKPLREGPGPLSRLVLLRTVGRRCGLLQLSSIPN